MFQFLEGGSGRLPVPFMTEVSRILAPDAVDDAFPAANKKALFHQLATVAGRRIGVSDKGVLAALNERERLGSTGFGNGVAIPHGRLDALGRVTGYFVRLAQPIDFGAIDGMPVDLVFMLLSPPDAGADHLKALASVSRSLRNTQNLAKLRGARSRDAIYALLAGEETRDAA